MAQRGARPSISFRRNPVSDRDGIVRRVCGRSGEPGLPSRSDAIRCLIGMGLSAAYAERKPAQTSNEIIFDKSRLRTPCLCILDLSQRLSDEKSETKRRFVVRRRRGGAATVMK